MLIKGKPAYISITAMLFSRRHPMLYTEQEEENMNMLAHI